jgi:hypothetical protein
MNQGLPPRQGLLHFVRAFATPGLAISAVIGAACALASGNWIMLPAMVLIWMFWRVLPSDDAPPGLHFSFSFHLLQIVIVVFYTILSGRQLTPHTAAQYHLMMVLGVFSVAAMFVGFVIADRWLARSRRPVQRIQLDVSLTQFALAYIAGVILRDSVVSLVNVFPAFAQAILAISAVQMGLYYLLLRKLFREQRYVIILMIVGFETVRGFSGFYSTFKEPLILALIAGMEAFEPRRVTHWALSALLVCSVVALSVVWLGIRGEIRADIARADVVRTQTQRLEFAYEEFQTWWRTESEYKMYDVDALVERVWDIYYTALALDRVPSVLPHEEGAIMSTAIQHVLTPRFLNPNKPPLPSESDDVIKYAGVKVAGREQGTTIAFGYVIQSYIDYGIPWFVVPPFAFGLLLGASYRYFMTSLRHEEILIAVLAVGFWANIMPYNTAWAKMLGKLLTSLVYIGGIALIVDHYLYMGRLRRMEEQVDYQQQQQQQQRPARLR